MIIQQLFLSEEIFCNFREGVNIILGVKQPHADEPSEGADTNGVGKTTIVNCVRYALGCGVSQFSNLDYFKEKKYWVRLQVRINANAYTLVRPLWKPLGDSVCMIFTGTLDSFNKTAAKTSIALSQIENDEDVTTAMGAMPLLRIMSLEDFKSELSRMENVDYSKANLSFQNLLEYIARDEKTGYGDIISMPSRTQWVQYRAIQYLFGLPFMLELEVADVKKAAAKKRAEYEMMNHELDIRKITSSDTIVNRRLVYSKHLAAVREQLSQVVVSKNLEHVRKEYAEVRSELSRLNALINNTEHKARSYKDTLAGLKEKGEALASLMNIETFYEDLVDFFPGKVKNNLEQYKEFFTQVSADRTAYYEDLLLVLEKELKGLRIKRKSISDSLDLLSNRFNSTSIVSDVSSLASQEEGIHRDLKELELMEAYLNQSEILRDEIEGLVQKRDDLVKAGRDQEKLGRKDRESIITLFKEWVELVYGTDEGFLEFHLNSNTKSEVVGRTEIECYIPSKSSFGRGVAMIVLFDLVWFLRRHSTDEFDPQFLIHDGPYVVISDEAKPKILDLIISLLAGTNKQYILTANEGDLPNLEKYRPYVCKELDGSAATGKFLKEQFNDRMA
jgi:uncharacterized protein YydD (DUF2326 family)